jgi:hypothetical protein
MALTAKATVIAETRVLFLIPDFIVEFVFPLPPGLLDFRQARPH